MIVGSMAGMDGDSPIIPGDSWMGAPYPNVGPRTGKSLSPILRGYENGL